MADASEPTGTPPITAAAWPRHRQWRLVAVLAALVVAFAAGYWVVHRHDHDGAVEGPGSDGATSFKPTPAQLKTFGVETVTLRPFEGEERTDGRIAVNGDRATAVYSPYSGRVTKVLAGLGDAVAAGAPLAYVQATEFGQAQSDMAAAAAAAQLARVNEARKRALYEAKGGSLQDWQQAQSDLAAAEASLRAVRNRLAVLGKSGAEIDAMERGSGDAAHGLAPLVAPISGVVVDRQVGPGQFLQAGSGTAVYTVADLSSVWLVANVREVDAARVRRGQAVEVRVPAYPERVFAARVTYVAPLVDAATHRITVRAEIDNHDRALKPEMIASFRIVTAGAVQAPGVPESAVVYESDTAHIWVLGADQSLEYRPIKTGRTLSGWVEVTDGLKAGERVATKGSLFIDRAVRSD